MRLRTLSTLLSQALSHLPGAEYEHAKCEALAAQVQEQRAHIEDLARRLEYTTRQKDEAEEAHVDAYEIRLDKIEGERDAIKAQYEAEKVAHGETQRHLTAAIAERDEARHDCESQRLARVKTLRDFNDAISERNAAEAERNALRVRVTELQAGEPVAWRVDYERAPGEHCCWFVVSPGEMKRLGPVGKLTPLFEAPQPAAPVVDRDAIREALKTLRSVRVWTAGDLQTWADAFDAIVRAIGEGS